MYVTHYLLSHITTKHSLRSRWEITSRWNLYITIQQLYGNYRKETHLSLISLYLFFSDLVHNGVCI